LNIYNFSRETWTTYTPGETTYASTSLFAQTSFLENELRNRCEMVAMFGIPKESDGTWILEQEAELGLVAPEDVRRKFKPGQLRETMDGKTLAIRLEDKDHMVCTYSDSTLDAAGQTAFKKLLIYRAQIHPDACTRLTADGRLPARLVQYSKADLSRNGEQSVETIVTTYELTGIGAWDPGLSQLPGDLHRTPSGVSRIPPLAGALERAGSCQVDPDALEQETEEFTGAALASSHPFDAALAWVELGIATGRAPGELPPEVSEAVRKDKQAKKYFEATGWKNQKEAKKAAEKLQSLDRKDLVKAYVIDVEAGSAWIAAGDLEKGFGLLIGTLQVDPCLAGVWVDVGQCLLQAAREWAAWECFLAARRMVPANCELLAPVVSVEAGLRDRYPERF